MNRLLFGLLTIVLLLSGCGDQAQKGEVVSDMPADSLLSRDEMISLLTDVQVIEGALVHQRNRGLPTEEDAKLFYAALFHKYGISRGCYLANVQHYQQDHEEFAKMYNVVVQRITDRQNNYDPKKLSKFGVNSDSVN